MNKYITVFLLLSACTIQHEFEDNLDVNLGFDLEDQCLTCFPQCTNDHDQFCVTANGNLCEQCMVSCLGARKLVCETEESFCYNIFAGEDFEVPVICIKTEVEVTVEESP